ncbi:MAG: RNase H-like domain-containing protein [Nitrososphaerales archaeon]
MRSGRGFIQLLNATSKWKCVPKIRRLGTLEPAPFSDAEMDEKLLDVATEEEIRLRAESSEDDETRSVFTALLSPPDVVDAIPNNSTTDPDAITEEQWKAFNFDADLTPEELASLKQIIQKHRRCFAFTTKEMGKVKDTLVVIDTGESKPVYQRQFRLSQLEQEEVRRQVREAVQQGIMAPSSSPYNSPVFLVPKKDGTRRLVVDFRRLNANCIHNTYPIPRPDDVFDRLHGASIFASLDAMQGFYQLEMDEGSKLKTSFSTPDGKFHYNRMPFGYINAPAEFQAMMDRVLGQLKWTIALVYIDDLLIYAKSYEELLERIDVVLDKCGESGLTFKPSKCSFAFKKLKFLGHVISGDGYEVDPDKIKQIQELPKPLKKAELQSFLGLCNYYRKYIKGFANTAGPLYALTKFDRIMWTPETESLYQELKDKLSSPPVLQYPSFDAQIQITSDSSGYGVGGICEQSMDGKEWHPIAYCSRVLKKHEQKYTTTQRECLAIVYALRQFRTYFYGRRAKVVTDHAALKYLTNLKDPYNQLARWALEIASYQVDIVYRPGKEIVHADCLSRNPVRAFRLLTDTTHKNKLVKNDEFLSLNRYSLENFRNEQLDDPKLRKIITKMGKKAADPVTGNIYQDNYAIVNDILYHYDSNAVQNPWRLVIPSQARQKVFQLMHDSPEGGHFGIYKTYKEIHRRYWWPEMFQDTKRYIAGCLVCQSFRIRNSPPAGHMVIKPAPTKSFYRVGIDYVEKREDQPLTDQGNRYALVIVDHASRYSTAGASKTATCEDSIQLVDELLFQEWGVPAQIVCDNGKHFAGQEFKDFCKKNGIELIFTTPYHPQSNGIVESCNKAIKEYIHKFQFINPTNWDKYLKRACHARNTKVCEATGYTPYFLAKHSEARTVADNFLPVLLPDDNDSPSVIAVKKEKALIYASRKLEEAQRKRKKRYDAIHPQMNYKVGDYVFRVDRVRKPGKPRLLGPYKIVQKRDEKTFKLERMFESRRARFVRVIAEDLHPFTLPMFDEAFAPRLSTKNNSPDVDSTLDLVSELFRVRLDVQQQQNRNQEQEVVLNKGANIVGTVSSSSGSEYGRATENEIEEACNSQVQLQRQQQSLVTENRSNQQNPRVQPAATTSQPNDARRRSSSLPSSKDSFVTPDDPRDETFKPPRVRFDHHPDPPASRTRARTQASSAIVIEDSFEGNADEPPATNTGAQESASSRNDFSVIIGSAQPDLTVDATQCFVSAEGSAMEISAIQSATVDAAVQRQEGQTVATTMFAQADALFSDPEIPPVPPAEINTEEVLTEMIVFDASPEEKDAFRKIIKDQIIQRADQLCETTQFSEDGFTEIHGNDTTLDSSNEDRQNRQVLASTPHPSTSSSRTVDISPIGRTVSRPDSVLSESEVLLPRGIFDEKPEESTSVPQPRAIVNVEDDRQQIPSGPKYNNDVDDDHNNDDEIESLTNMSFSKPTAQVMSDVVSEADNDDAIDPISDLLPPRRMEKDALTPPEDSTIVGSTTPVHTPEEVTLMERIANSPVIQSLSKTLRRDSEREAARLKNLEEFERKLSPDVRAIIAKSRAKVKSQSATNSGNDSITSAGSSVSSTSLLPSASSVPANPLLFDDLVIKKLNKAKRVAKKRVSALMDQAKQRSASLTDDSTLGPSTLQRSTCVDLSLIQDSTFPTAMPESGSHSEQQQQQQQQENPAPNGGQNMQTEPMQMTDATSVDPPRRITRTTRPEQVQHFRLEFKRKKAIGTRVEESRPPQGSLSDQQTSTSSLAAQTDTEQSSTDDKPKGPLLRILNWCNKLKKPKVNSKFGTF